MEQGVCVYDADNKVVLLNRRYLTMFNMSAEIVQIGTRYRDVLSHSASLGNFPASDALYQATAKGRGAFRLFEPEMEEEARSRHALEHDLRTALERREFHLVYQPQVRLDSSELTGFEALLRWKLRSRSCTSCARSACASASTISVPR